MNSLFPYSEIHNLYLEMIDFSDNLQKGGKVVLLLRSYRCDKEKICDL
ncbi:hypothetical protein [Clostridium sp. CAG:265]|nr:hypothetical protein [Clostridium sp. CAG:265]CDB76164.1 unknown [Clostridium sp. CAG:265]